MPAQPGFDLTILLHETFMLTLRLSAPPLLALLVVGLTISLVQAVTQINEATLAFLPKVAALCAVLTLLGASMASALADYSQRLFAAVIAIGLQ